MVRTKPCPICRRPAATGFAPFCSQGCRDRDLLQWLGEGYAIPGRPTESEAAEEESGNVKSGGGCGLDSDEPRD